jgi:hypothetical protein
MSVMPVLSITLKALCPNVEYNSSPGVQVSREMRRREESWALTELLSKKLKVKSKNKIAFFKLAIINFWVLRFLTF